MSNLPVGRLGWDGGRFYN